MVYYSSKELVIRSIRKEDAEIIYKKHLSYGWYSRVETYLNYYEDQENKARLVFVAESEGTVVGYCTLILHPTEGPFGNKGIPEISDLGVFVEKRNNGIGSKLLDIAEIESKKISSKVYLGVGVHSGYGAAQRLYVRRGFIPDGSGVWYKGKQLEQYANCCNDDDLLLFMSKELI